MLAISAEVTLSRVRTWRVARAVDQRSNRSKIAVRRAGSPAAARWLKLSGAARSVVKEWATVSVSASHRAAAAGVLGRSASPTRAR
jgi:hypothetical protein